MSIKVDFDFLKKKSGAVEGVNNYYQNPNFYDTGSTNINRETDNVFSFEIYNYSKESEDDIKPIIYEVFVNIKTFKWVLFEQWVFDGVKQVKNISEFTKKKIESYIANKLLGSYFYTSSDEDANQQGSNLFPDPEYIERYTRLNMTSHRTGKLYIKNGEKRSLICDYRGYIWASFQANKRSKMTLIALKQIDKEFKIDSLESIDFFPKTYNHATNNFKQNILLIFVNGIIKTKNGRKIDFKMGWYGMSRNIIFYENGKVLSKIFMSPSDSFSQVYKIIPDFIESL